MSKHLPAVVAVEQDKCVNCHTCIAVCPVKFCNDGSGDKVAINSDLCIGCGNCLKACTHGARRGVDDTAACFAALKRGEQTVIIRVDAGAYAPQPSALIAVRASAASGTSGRSRWIAWKLSSRMPAPSCLDQPSLPHTHEQVPKRRGVQDARVVDDDEAHRQ